MTSLPEKVYAVERVAWPIACCKAPCRESVGKLLSYTENLPANYSRFGIVPSEEDS